MIRSLVPCENLRHVRIFSEPITGTAIGEIIFSLPSNVRLLGSFTFSTNTSYLAGDFLLTGSGASLDEHDKAIP